MTLAMEAVELGKRYGRRWGIRDCTLQLPIGSVAALVGPNGAGKTTLLHLAAGLLRPTCGAIDVLGGPAGRKDVIAKVGYVSQDKPLYLGFRVGEILQLGARLNPSWDTSLAKDWIRRVGIGMDQRVGGLSGGQRAQVAMALALGKRPEVILLDEPMANLDPLARREFLGMLMEQVAGSQVTVLMSSHMISELERVCDYLVLLSASQVQLAGDIDHLVAEHMLLTGPADQAQTLAEQHTVISDSYTGRQATLLLRRRGEIDAPQWTARIAGLEEIVLAYMSSTRTLPGEHHPLTIEARP